MRQKTQLTRSILKYIREARDYGLDDYSIEKALRQAGWNKKDITLGLTKIPARKVRTPRIRSNTHSFRLKSKNKKRIQYAAFFCLAFSLLLAGAVWAFIATNIHIGSLSYASIAAKVISKNAFTQSIVSTIVYSDPGTVELEQGSAHFTLSKPGATLDIALDKSNKEFTVGDMQGILHNQSLQQTFAAQFKTNSGAIQAKPAQINFQGPLLSKLGTLENRWISLAKPSIIHSKQNLLEHGTNLGIEYSNNKKLAHFTYKLNPLLLQQIIQTLPKQDIIIGTLTIPKAAVETITNTYAQGAQSIKVDAWTTVFPVKLERLTFTINAPSITVAISNQDVTNAIDDNRNSARVLASVYLLQQQLERYKLSHGGYPEGKNGSINNAEITIPQAPEQEKCPEKYNNLFYSTQGQIDAKTKLYPLYSVTFCLEQNVGELKAGIGVLTPNGILTQTQCPDINTTCFIPQTRITITDETKKLNLLSATITVDIQASQKKLPNIGNAHNAIPLSEALKNITSSN